MNVDLSECLEFRSLEVMIVDDFDVPCSRERDMGVTREDDPGIRVKESCALYSMTQVIGYRSVVKKDEGDVTLRRHAIKYG